MGRAAPSPAQAEAANEATDGGDIGWDDREFRSLRHRVQAYEPLDLVACQHDLVPTRNWVIPGWIPGDGHVSGLMGPSTAGKTTLIQQLLTSAAIGQPWLGLDVGKFRSLAVLGEDDEKDALIRQDAINRFLGCGLKDLEPMRLVPRRGYDNVLAYFDNGRLELTPFFHQVLRDTEKHRARLVAIDPLASVFEGDQNNPTQARLFVEQVLGRIARATGGGGLLILGHPVPI